MAKSFQDRINEIKEYNPDISYKDGVFALIITFNEHWQIIKPKDGDVGYAPDKKVKTLHWYASTIENSDKVFDLIAETIAVNKEFEKKTALYKEKVRELQELFLSDIAYEKLKSVHFVIDNRETKPKAKKSVQKDNKGKKGNVKPQSETKENKETTEEKNNTPTEEPKPDSEYKGDIDSAIEEALKN